MNKKITWLVEILIFASVSVAVGADTSEPFWKSKKDVYKRIKEDRAIVVSAKTTKENSKTKITLIAAGRIHAPLFFTHKIATDYSQYKKILPYVDEAIFDTKESRLTAKGSFMGFSSKMVVTVKGDESSSGGHIKWEVYSGFLTGMSGVITEEKISDEVTEISLDANYTGGLELPSFLINWGFEFLGQKMAQSMRSHVESQWEKEKQ